MTTERFDKYKNPVDIGDVIAFGGAYSSTRIERGEIVGFTAKGNPKVVMFDYIRPGGSIPTPKAITKEFVKIGNCNNC